MSEEIQPQEAGVQANRLMFRYDIIADAPESPSQSLQQNKGDDENPGSLTAADEGDPVEAELVAKLEILLTKDIELSTKYGVLLQHHRKTGRERRTIRAELRQLHTDEGAILLDVKLHRAQKGRGGGWAEFLRQRKPKRLSRTTADRWIQWYLDSKKQEQSQSEPPLQAPENAPQNESGAFSCGGAQSQLVSGDPQLSVAADPPSANGSKSFEDLQQVILLLKKRQTAHFKAAAEFLVAKTGFKTSHEAIYLTVTEAAARIGFVYPATAAEEGETRNVSKGVNPGSETPTAGIEAA